MNLLKERKSCMNVNEKAVNEHSVEIIKHKVLKLVSENLRTKNKTNAALIKEIKALIEGEAKCYYNR